ncbi:MAG: hypothetical protein ABI422_03315 [Sphingomicrobium sp.]
MSLLIAAAIAAIQPAVVQAAPAPVPHSQMGKMDQAGPNKEACCCMDMMGKDHASHDMDRMPDHQGHADH